MTDERPRKPEEIVEENRDLFERLAATDLPAAPYFQRALDRVDEMRSSEE